MVIGSCKRFEDMTIFVGLPHLKDNECFWAGSGSRLVKLNVNSLSIATSMIRTDVGMHQFKFTQRIGNQTKGF